MPMSAALAGGERDAEIIEPSTRPASFIRPRDLSSRRAAKPASSSETLIDERRI
jgi:hypothetical protein